SPAAARIVSATVIDPDPSWGWGRTGTGLALLGDYAVVSWTQPDMMFGYSGSGGVDVLDVSDPANPRLTGTYTTLAEVSSLTVAGTRAYLAVTSLQTSVFAGIDVVDLSNPANPQQVTRFGYNLPGGYGTGIGGPVFGGAYASVAVAASEKRAWFSASLYTP